MGHLYYPFLTTQTWEKPERSEEPERSRAKRCPLNMSNCYTWELPEAVTACRRPTQEQSIFHHGEGGAYGPIPGWEAINSWWLLEEGDSVFFKVWPLIGWPQCGRWPHEYVGSTDWTYLDKIKSQSWEGSSRWEWTWEDLGGGVGEEYGQIWCVTFSKN